MLKLGGETPDTWIALVECARDSFEDNGSVKGADRIEDKGGVKRKGERNRSCILMNGNNNKGHLRYIINDLNILRDH